MFGFWKKSRETITIHPAASSDLSACADIHQKCFSQNWAEHVLASMLTNRGTKCLVAKTSRSKGKPAGFLMYRISAQEAEILTVAVDPDRQNVGTGTALCEELIRLCLHDRLEEIFLEVDDSNQAALKIYRRLGFQKVGERRGYYSSTKNNTGNGEDHSNHSKGHSDSQSQGQSQGNALIMRLDLSA